jgi:hypothetical protein
MTIARGVFAAVLLCPPVVLAQPDTANLQGTALFASAPLRALADVPWATGVPHVRLAIPYTRYNRVEGISPVVVAGWEVSPERVLAAQIRLGSADLVPNAEVELVTTRGARKYAFAAYHRLSHASIWGNPLALGHSLGVLVIGRDDGFYYRAGGAEFRYSDTLVAGFHGRIFAERHRAAEVKNDFAIADIFGKRRFPPNIDAVEGDVAGIAARVSRRRGELPSEFRTFGEIEIEAAFGAFDYGRAIAEGVVSVPLNRTVFTMFAAAIGSSGGSLPVQRAYFIGGSRSARGQRAGVMAGDAFWMTQLELATINVFARPVIFFDAAWAGARESLGQPGRVATGAGVGFSMFDGSLRLDIAKGIRPGRAVRGSLYLEARM